MRHKKMKKVGGAMARWMLVFAGLFLCGAWHSARADGAGPFANLDVSGPPAPVMVQPTPVKAPPAPAEQPAVNTTTVSNTAKPGDVHTAQHALRGGALATTAAGTGLRPAGVRGARVPPPKSSAGGSTGASATGASTGETGSSNVDGVESMPIPAQPSAPGHPSTHQGMLARGSVVRSALQVGGALAIVIGLLLIGRAVTAKLTGKGKTAGARGVIEVLAKQALSKHQSIMLVRIGAQIVAINQGKDSGQSVLVINDPIEVASILGQVQGGRGDSMQASFRHLLGHVQKDMEKPRETAAEPDPQAEEEMANLDDQLDDMAAARRQLMELRKQVQSVRQTMTVN